MRRKGFREVSEEVLTPCPHRRVRPKGFLSADKLESEHTERLKISARQHFSEREPSRLVANRRVRPTQMSTARP
jgi:hypothetical protein